MNNARDEYAIASMMYDMREYIAGGAEVYPMTEALEDAYLLPVREAVKQPGCGIVPESILWQAK